MSPGELGRDLETGAATVRAWARRVARVAGPVAASGLVLGAAAGRWAFRAPRRIPMGRLAPSGPASLAIVGYAAALATVGLIVLSSDAPASEEPSTTPAANRPSDGTAQTETPALLGLEAIASRVGPAVVTLAQESSSGTGFLAWRRSGGTYALTAVPAVAEALEANPRTVTVTQGAEEIEGRIVKVDRSVGLAVVRLEETLRPRLWEELDEAPAALKAGDRLALVVGSPSAGSDTPSATVEVVGTARIELDVTADAVPAGTPAVDEEGRLVGVVWAEASEIFVVPIALACRKLRVC